jgi:dTDP-glucose 4,6-dehydratase
MQKREAERMAKMRILVTGGAGFIGANFIHYMLKAHPDYDIVNLDKLTYSGNLENLRQVERNPHYKFVKGDICDRKLVDSLMKEVDAVVHFAAESHVDRSIQDSGVFVTTNVLGTQVLLDSAKENGNKRFHHVSTDEVFGELGQEGKFSEDTPYGPRSPYSASKAGSDHLVRSYYFTHGLPITISNCSNNYGPYQFPEKLMPLFITNLLEGKKVPVYGTGKNIRDWLYVDDHCRAIDLILHQGVIGRTYCIGGNSEKTNLEVTWAILNEMGLGEEMIEYVEDRKGHDYRYAMDFSRLNKELGWQPKVSFEEGIKQTVRWYRDNASWWKSLKNKK